MIWLAGSAKEMIYDVTKSRLLEPFLSRSGAASEETAAADGLRGKRLR